MRRPLWLGGGVAVLLVCLTLVVFLVVGGGSTDRDRTKGPSASAEQVAARCKAFRTAFPDWDAVKGRTFTALVQAPLPDAVADATGSAFLLLAESKSVDFGLWTPAIDYLKQNARHDVLHAGDAVPRTAAVVEAARRADADIVAGQCRTASAGVTS